MEALVAFSHPHNLLNVVVSQQTVLPRRAYGHFDDTTRALLRHVTFLLLGLWPP